MISRRPGTGRVRRWIGALVVAGTALGLLAGCGIPSEEAPEAIDGETVPGLQGPITAPPTTVDPATSVKIALYFSDTEGETLVEVPRQIENNTDPAGALLQLLAGPTEDERRRLATSIPADTQLLGATVDDDSNVVTVNLSRGIENIQGASLTNAFAQIVWTVTGLSGGVERVRFQVEGEDRPALSDAGNLDVVGRSDYEGANRPTETADGDDPP